MTFSCRILFFLFAVGGLAAFAAPVAASDPAGDVRAADLQPFEDARKAVADALGLSNAPRLDLELIARGLNALRIRPYDANDWSKGIRLPSVSEVRLTPEEWVDVAQLVFEAVAISSRAAQRERAHRRRLAARGIAEVPPSTAACRYRLDVGGKSFVFDRWGEFYVDRRFVTDREMDVVRRLESYYRKVFARSAYAAEPQNPHPAPPPTTAKRPTPRAAAPKVVSRAEARRTWKVPVFRGFEDDRYQQYDALVLRLTADFNAHKREWIGGTAEQAAGVADLSPAQVKAHMIEESGGNGPVSRAAWAVDPLQVNVPGDWSDAKLDLGLSKPARRNEGTLEGNVRAAIMFLARKGFSTSGRAARVRAKGFFDGWPTALKRYNARRDRTADGRFYDEAYSEKIRRRAENPDLFVPIEIRLGTAK